MLLYTVFLCFLVECFVSFKICPSQPVIFVSSPTVDPGDLFSHRLVWFLTKRFSSLPRLCHRITLGFVTTVEDHFESNFQLLLRRGLPAQEFPSAKR